MKLLTLFVFTLLMNQAIGQIWKSPEFASTDQLDKEVELLSYPKYLFTEPSVWLELFEKRTEEKIPKDYVTKSPQLRQILYAFHNSYAGSFFNRKTVQDQPLINQKIVFNRLFNKRLYQLKYNKVEVGKIMLKKTGKCQQFRDGIFEYIPDFESNKVRFKRNNDNYLIYLNEDPHFYNKIQWVDDCSYRITGERLDGALLYQIYDISKSGNELKEFGYNPESDSGHPYRIVKQMRVSPLPTNKYSNGVQWYTWENAMAENAKERRQLFVYVVNEEDMSEDNTRMDAILFSNETIAQYVHTNFYPIKVNAKHKESIEFRGESFTFKNNNNADVERPTKREYHSLAVELLEGKMNIPSIIYLDKEFRRLQSLELNQFDNEYSNDGSGFKQFTKILRYFGGEHYIKTKFEDFE